MWNKGALTRRTQNDFRHEVLLSSTVLNLNNDITKEQFTKAYASIRELNPSAYNKDGLNVDKSLTAETHVIHIRWSPAYSLSSFAWVTEIRKKSGNKVYSVLRIQEYRERQRHVVLWCRIANAGELPVRIDSPFVIPQGAVS
jgi:hypothetical protein